jgi:hypothetical protein
MVRESNFFAMSMPVKDQPHAQVPGTMSGTKAKSVVRSSLFKFYLHDSIAECRLQLIGEVSEAEIPELNGCWLTAKTTLGSRRLVLDLRRARAADDAALRWLAFMGTESAIYQPDNFLRNALAGKIVTLDTNQTRTPRPSLLGRLASLLRGVGVAAAD